MEEKSVDTLCRDGTCEMLAASSGNQMQSLVIFFQRSPLAVCANELDMSRDPDTGTYLDFS